MPRVALVEGAIAVGERFRVSFQRTLRVPSDGSTYPLPPTLGPLPVGRVEDLGERAPLDWRERGGFFVPLYQREALWLAFDGTSWKPNAVQVAVGGVNAVSGEPWEERLVAEPQNYLVCPTQPWLDGVNAGEGFVRQFVAVPLGSGATIEGRLTGKEDVGGIQLRVYEPKPGVFPDEPSEPAGEPELVPRPMASPSMGLGAGGRIRQKVYPDEHGLETWDLESAVDVAVHLLNTEQYRELTGREPPPTPVDARAYTEYGLPWFELYDEAAGDVAAAERLAEVEAVTEGDEPVRVDPSQVRGIDPGKRRRDETP